MAKVLVAGSINMDVVARAPRQPRPGETVAGTGAATYPGGKGANQAVAAARAGAKTVMIGSVGADQFGERLRTFLDQQGVNCSYVQCAAAAPTGMALIVVADDGENSIVVVPGANALLRPESIGQAPIDSGDVVVSQFEIPLDTIASLFARCRAVGVTTVLNPAPAQPCPRTLLDLTDLLVVNETELAVLLQEQTLSLSSNDAVAAASRRLRCRGDQIVVTTLGPRGAVAVAGDQMFTVRGHRVAAVDTTAAGDTFIGVMAARLAHGWPLERALHYANAAAALCVQRPGAAPSIPAAADIDAFMKQPS